jgi:hypothetical protein
MKKQTNPTIKAHLIRGAFYLFLLLAVCAIPLALAQRNTKQNAAAGKMSRLVPPSTALAPASAFRVPVPKVPNAKGIGRNASLASILGNIPLFTYLIDDGTAEDSVGLTAGGNLLCLNSFPISAGNNLITSISIAWGTPAFPDPTLDGLAYTAVLWSDPNGDGSPTDAVVLATAPGVVSQQGTNTFLTSVITPTMVTTPNFFVGFVIAHAAGQFPAAFDTDAPTLSGRSWVSIGGNINNLSDAVTIESVGLVGNWLIRAEGEGGGTPSPTPTPTCAPTYTTATGTGTITPGGTDIGNHCDDCNTDISLPFPVSVYGHPPISVATVGSNGDLQLTTTPSEKLFYQPDQCVPLDPDPAAHGPFLDTLFPYYADLVTDESVGPCPDCGVFTQTLGTAPNRQFVIRWKTNYFNIPGSTAEFQVLLTEGSDTLSVIYGTTADNGLTAVSGIQADLTLFTSFSCFEAVLTSGLRVDYIPTGCGSPTPTPTATATATPTATVVPRATPTPRPRPTPAPRP